MRVAWNGQRRWELADLLYETRQAMFPPGSILHGLLASDPEDPVQQRAKNELQHAIEEVVALRAIHAGYSDAVLDQDGPISGGLLSPTNGAST